MILHPSTRSRKDVLGRWTSTKTSSLRVLYSGCKIVTTKYTLVWIVLVLARCMQAHQVNKKGSPYSITERRVPELIPSFGSQPAGDMSHKPGGRLPLLSARPAVTLATLKRAATNFAAW